MAKNKTTKTQLTAAPTAPDLQQETQALLVAVRQLIEAARTHVATSANSTLTQLYWQVGQKVATDMLTGGRAAYGQEILPTLSAKLVPTYGKGFSERNLARMVSFVQAFPAADIVVTLSRELSWSHFIEILPLKAPLEREFYTEICRVERWSVRTLRERIASQLYLRSAIAKQPESVITSELNQLREGGQVTPDMVFRDPYMLDFLGLLDGYSERDLESANIRVAQYLQALPELQVLQTQLHRVVQLARERQVGSDLPDNKDEA